MVATQERKPLTPKQRSIFEYIKRYIDRHKYPPTLREIASAHGITSTNGVVCHLRPLEAKGYIARAHGDHTRALARSITIVQDEPEPGPHIRVTNCGRLVTVDAAGPVTFTQAEWVEWLRGELARAGETGGAK